jgi:type I restriction enzyme R subunit
VLDPETGEGIIFEKPKIRYPDGRQPDGTWIVKEARKKIYVNGVDVSILVSRELYFDQQGRPITVSLKDHTKEIIKGKFASLDEFLIRWNNTERKEAIIQELQQQGVLVEALLEAVENNCDLFDLICHIAYDQPPLTRKERANNVKKRNYFIKYGEQSRKVLEALLDKYADEGIENLESMEVLKVKPLNEFGSPVEIINEFGSKEEYLRAVKELETELYKTA